MDYAEEKHQYGWSALERQKLDLFEQSKNSPALPNFNHDTHTPKNHKNI